MTITDYVHELRFGSFLTPTSQAPERVVELALISERSGLNLVTFQDHPYQPRFLDTWTLLSWVAARTEHIHLAGNVHSLPLRPPAVLARAAASLDLLSGGRFELGLGAGAFWDAIEAMGGPRRSPGEAVQATSEALDIIREIWAADERGGVRVDGEQYRVVGAKRGPAPAHEVPIWVGALGPRMLRLLARKADGWLPSYSNLKAGDLARGNRIIDDAAVEAGRQPGDIRRLLNIGSRDDGLSVGQWAEELLPLVIDNGVSTFILATDEERPLREFGEELAPELARLVARERRHLLST